MTHTVQRKGQSEHYRIGRSTRLGIPMYRMRVTSTRTGVDDSLHFLTRVELQIPSEEGQRRFGVTVEDQAA